MYHPPHRNDGVTTYLQTSLPAPRSFFDLVKGASKLKGGGAQEYDLLIVDYETAMEQQAGSSDADEDSGWNCSVHPSVFFLLGTLMLTTCATGMLCAAIMTDHWEEVSWDRVALQTLSNRSVRIEWLLDGKVASVATNNERAFLVPIHGGIWTLCFSLNEEEIQLLGAHGFPPQSCVNYLSGEMDGMKVCELKADWQRRMQNLSISCALVCLIILGTAALVGAFGVCQHQISAVLVTGVMYLLAASFALFTLSIIHFKRVSTRPPAPRDEETDGGDWYRIDADCTVDGVVWPVGSRGYHFSAHLLAARVFDTSWSLDLGWGGVMLCVITSVLWILLSKIMRFNPISSMINY
ncbi:uncharacterized protein [Atheta coriaria]|uniref:uncharacterized protein n=1 Tax=Dalotia coriaria TaxID=877792 RepID=UPI0031F44F77